MKNRQFKFKGSSKTNPDNFIVEITSPEAGIAAFAEKFGGTVTGAKTMEAPKASASHIRDTLLQAGYEFN